jgi:hypothetical protein
MKKPFLKLLLLTFIALMLSANGSACSGYKITIGDKTVFGSNEDAWRLTPHIWFENKAGSGKYGAAFTGSRFDGANGYAPQSGMNEMGLAFERLVAYHPEQAGFASSKKIENPTNYLKDILHSCKTVEEVRDYISQYDHSYFIDDIFMYFDQSGKYLIVEPYTLTIGNAPTYVFSNFCPSITSPQAANKLDRYRNGAAFVKQSVDTTLEFCSALSDTMHVCRGKIGDGTLLTSIWDLKKRTVNLYFYHDYSKTIQFDLSSELKKGDHRIAIATLFPPNSEFEALGNYLIPKNNIFIGVFIVFSAGFFLLSSFFFLFQFLRRKAKTRFSWLQFMLFPIGLVMTYYMYVLLGSINVFYFPAPYKDPSNFFVSLSSYVPFLMALLILPLVIINYKLFKETSWNAWAKRIFTLNTLMYCILIGLSVYWEFYSI